MPKHYLLLFLFFLTHFVSAQENFNITKISNALFSPVTMDFEIRGDFAYCADEYGLSVWDMSDPENLTKISHCQTAGKAYRLCINGDFAYIPETGYGLTVVDISDLENPEVVNQIEVDLHRGGDYLDLTINDGLLYICGGRYGFYIASIEDPAEPEILYQYQVDDSHIHKFLFTEDASYLLGTGLSVLNVQDPENVEVINYVDLGNAYDICYYENRLGIITEDGLSFYSLDDPHEPEFVGLYETRIWIYTGAMQISGDIAYAS